MSREPVLMITVQPQALTRFVIEDVFRLARRMAESHKAYVQSVGVKEAVALIDAGQAAEAPVTVAVVPRGLLWTPLGP